MRTLTIGLGTLACLALLASTGCDGNWCLGDDCSTECQPDWGGGCEQDCRCWGECGCDCGCSDDDWDDWDEWGDWCTSDADCPTGHVCHPNDFCVEVVEGCPLTDDCLGDPEGYTPEWMGIDPLFVGSFSGPDGGGRTELMIDFYDDHIYGEAQVVLTDADGWPIEWLWVVITGTRDGASLWGQIVDANAWERDFDATFEATLLSASEMVGQVTVASDEGEFTADFQLYRTSPCGCEPDAGCELDEDCAADQVCQDGACVDAPDPGCQADADCPQGQLCVRGECLAICFLDEDCADGQICQDHACVDGCPTECCADADCADGEACLAGACQAVCQTECCAHSDCPLGYDCVEGVCLNPCTHWCDCEEGQDCIDGYCQTAP